jgi:hypothetical protein
MQIVVLVCLTDVSGNFYGQWPPSSLLSKVGSVARKDQPSALTPRPWSTSASGRKTVNITRQLSPPGGAIYWLSARVLRLITLCLANHLHH